MSLPIAIDKCPICNDKSNYVGEEVRIESGQAFQECYCSTCNAIWTDVYKLEHQIIQEVRET